MWDWSIIQVGKYYVAAAISLGGFFSLYVIGHTAKDALSRLFRRLKESYPYRDWNQDWNDQ